MSTIVLISDSVSDTSLFASFPVNNRIGPATIRFSKTTIGVNIIINIFISGAVSFEYRFGFPAASVFGKMSQKINTTSVSTTVTTNRTRLSSPQKCIANAVTIVVSTMFAKFTPTKIVLNNFPWLRVALSIDAAPFSPSSSIFRNFILLNIVSEVSDNEKNTEASRHTAMIII
jgi:hypothetical protein